MKWGAFIYGYVWRVLHQTLGKPVKFLGPQFLLCVKRVKGDPRTLLPRISEMALSHHTDVTSSGRSSLTAPAKIPVPLPQHILPLHHNNYNFLKLSWFFTWLFVYGLSPSTRVKFREGTKLVWLVLAESPKSCTWHIDVPQMWNEWRGGWMSEFSVTLEVPSKQSFSCGGCRKRRFGCRWVGRRLRPRLL